MKMFIAKRKQKHPNVLFSQLFVNTWKLYHLSLNHWTTVDYHYHKSPWPLGQRVHEQPYKIWATSVLLFILTWYLYVVLLQWNMYNCFSICVFAYICIYIQIVVTICIHIQYKSWKSWKYFNSISVLLCLNNLNFSIFIFLFFLTNSRLFLV